MFLCFGFDHSTCFYSNRCQTFRIYPKEEPFPELWQGQPSHFCQGQCWWRCAPKRCATWWGDLSVEWHTTSRTFGVVAKGGTGWKSWDGWWLQIFWPPRFRIIMEVQNGPSSRLIFLTIRSCSTSMIIGGRAMFSNPCEQHDEVIHYLAIVGGFQPWIGCRIRICPCWLDSNMCFPGVSCWNILIANMISLEITKSSNVWVLMRGKSSPIVWLGYPLWNTCDILILPARGPPGRFLGNLQRIPGGAGFYAEVARMENGGFFLCINRCFDIMVCRIAS